MFVTLVTTAFITAFKGGTKMIIKAILSVCTFMAFFLSIIYECQGETLDAIYFLILSILLFGARNGEDEQQ